MKIIMEANYSKKNIFTRIYYLLKSNSHASWENALIVLIGFFLSTILANYFGVIDFIFADEITDIIYIEGSTKDYTSMLGPYFFILIGLIEIYIVTKSPLQIMSKNIFIFAFLNGLAISSGIFTYYFEMKYEIIITLIWIIIYILFQLTNDKDLSKIGLLSFLIYLIVMIPTTDVLSEIEVEFIGIIGICGFLCVLLCALPMFIIRLYQKDPGKRRLLAKLYSKDIGYHELIKTTNELIKFDKNKRDLNLIYMAKELFLAKSTLKSLDHYITNKKDYNIFINEVDRLTEKVKKAILNGYDAELEINLGYITEYQKNIEFYLEQIPNKNSQLEFIDYTIKNYRSLFEKLNSILANKLIINEFPTIKKSNNILKIFKKINLRNINIRYSIRSIISLFFAGLADTFIIPGDFGTATIISALSIKPTTSNTNKDILIRLISTLIGAIFGIIISIILNNYDLNIITVTISILCFCLYFVYQEDVFLSGIFIMIALIFIENTDTITFTIDTLIITILCIIVIVIIGNFVLPVDEKSNLIKLLKNKINLTIKITDDILIQNIKNEETNKQIIKTNFNIEKIIHKLEDTYNNIDNEIKLFKEINSALDEYVNFIKITKKHLNKNHRIEFGKINKDILNNYLLKINGKEINYKKSEQKLLVLIEQINNNTEKKFLYASFMIIGKNFIEINNILNKIKKIIPKYDKNILESNIKDGITIKNLKYLLNHYKLIYSTYKKIYFKSKNMQNNTSPLKYLKFLYKFIKLKILKPIRKFDKNKFRRPLKE